MKSAPETSLRASLIYLIILAMLTTLVAAGGLILSLRLPQIAKSNLDIAAYQAKELATRVDVLLDGLEARVHTISRIIPGNYRTTSSIILDNFADSNDALATLYVISPDGDVVFTGVSHELQLWRVNIFNIDFSANTLYQAALSNGRPTWSDHYISAINGQKTIALAVPFGQQVVIAEIPMAYILKATQISSGDPTLSTWVLNQQGEVLIDTAGKLQDDQAALMNMPLIQTALRGEKLPRTFSFHGTSYHPATARSSRMGWIFLAKMPADFDNIAYRSAWIDIGALGISSVFVALLLAYWSVGKVTQPIRALINQAHDVAEGNAPEHWPLSNITEFNRLSSDLEQMAGTLQTLNHKLEERVKQRTQELEHANELLTNTLNDLRATQADLVEAEKLAALGRLVAGVAHELNTPIGNGLMAVSTLSEESQAFERQTQQGVRRSELDSFIHDVAEAAEIATRNMQRAAQLVTSFKQVAVDQTSSQRREFVLKSVIDEILLTLQPTFKHTPYHVEANVPAHLNLDSYPGPLGQVLTNLITNALRHGFENRDHGSIHIQADQAEEGWINIQVADDGVGIPQELQSKVFMPFVSTRMGQGGSGLGLHIAHNLVTHVLGGSIGLENAAESGGTRFTLHIPLQAPALGKQDLAVQTL